MLGAGGNPWGTVRVSQRSLSVGRRVPSAFVNTERHQAAGTPTRCAARGIAVKAEDRLCAARAAEGALSCDKDNRRAVWPPF